MSVSPFWVTAFLDLAAPEHEAGLTFWAAVTATRPSEPRGSDAEFVSLLPADGDPHLKVQRMGEGPSRVHLDLHVTDLASGVRRASGLGARVLHTDEYAVLTSPGGLVFCLVTHEAPGRRAAAPTWPGGHRSEVDQVCLDLPPALAQGEEAFWRDLTGWELVTTDTEFDHLVRPPEQPIRILLQRLDDPAPTVTAHLDLATTDRSAETERHAALGAEVLAVHDEWTVLAAPGGPAYCLTDRAPRAT